MIRHRIPARSESERRQRVGFRTWFETFDTAAEAWQSLAEYETRLYRTELAVAECEKHGIDPERIAELSALGLDPQVAIRGLTEAGREVLK